MWRQRPLTVLSLLTGAWLLALAAARRARLRRQAALVRLCKRLPKAELHAHVAGCARLATVNELDTTRSRPRSTLWQRLSPRAALGGLTLDQCFERFATIHRALATSDALRRVAAEVLADFAADGVRYLELRSTPRALRDLDARSYVCTLVEAIVEFEERSRGAMPTRLLLSVDRAAPTRRADETVELALALRGERDDARRLLVGIDLSGNPSKGRFADFVPALSRARKAGLPISVHCAEIEDEGEMAEVLAFRPDRLGHALFLSAAHVAALRANPIPIELCPTSNLTTLRHAHMRDHPTAGQWLLDEVQAERYPVSINTDDTGVFGTCASAELARVAVELRLDAAHVAHLATRALDDAFEPAQGGSGGPMRELRARFAAEAAHACALYEEELAQVGSGWF